MFDSGHDNVIAGFEVNMLGEAHTWTLQAACDFMEMKAKGEKEANEDKNVDALSGSREISLYC